MRTGAGLAMLRRLWVFFYGRRDLPSGQRGMVWTWPAGLSAYVSTSGSYIAYEDACVHLANQT